jgi:hypothetical protein
MALKKDLELIHGKTWTEILRWEWKDQIVRKPITGFAWPNGTARITAVGHDLVNGWRSAVTGLPKMPISASDPNKIKDDEYHPATVISDDIIEFNDTNASEFKAYTSGGFLQYNTPVDLTDQSVRMMIKDKQGEYNLLKVASITTGIAGDTKPTAAGVDGGVTWEATTPADDVATHEWVAGATYAVDDVIDTKSMLFLTVGNGRIVVNDTDKTITLSVDAQLIAGFTWTKGFYDVEAFSSDATPIVTLLQFGKITVGKEVTK